MPAHVDFQKRPQSIETHLDDGATVCFRPIRPSDEPAIERGIRELSDHSRYLRFFSSFKSAPPSVIERLSAVDGFNHIAWGAVMTGEEGSPPGAAAHAIRDGETSDSADLAIAVLDQYHDRGIARLLLAALALDCRGAGLAELKFDILHRNKPAILLVKSLGAKTCSAAGSVVSYRLDVSETLLRLKNMTEPRGLHDIFSGFGEA